jgi:hypothetical protein
MDRMPVVRPGACQACFAPSRDYWSLSGSPAWLTRRGSASTPRPNPQRVGGDPLRQVAVRYEATVHGTAIDEWLGCLVPSPWPTVT